MRSKLLLVSVLAALTVSLTGCGGSADGPTVASADRSAGTAASGPSDVVAKYVEARRAWVECLRSGGVQVSDPDAKGSVELGGDLAQLKKDPTWLAAQEKCKHLSVEVPEDLREVPKLTPQQIEWARAFAACMRRYGQPDFPDPGPDGYPVAPRDQEPNAAGESPRKAEAICQPVLTGGAPNPSATPGPGLG